jgi:hypothetical protein
VLPRSVLALAGALRSHWLARHVALPLSEPYFQSLLRRRQGDVARVQIVPYASAPAENAARWLHAALASVLGDGAQLDTGATLAYGAEDDDAASLAPPAGTTLALALFDLTATPEAENHGRFARRLAAHVTTIIVIDEAAFRARFGGGSERLAQRRDAWRVFTEALGTLPVLVDMSSADDGDAARAVQLAMRSPVSADPP